LVLAEPVAGVAVGSDGIVGKVAVDIVEMVAGTAAAKVVMVGCTAEVDRFGLGIAVLECRSAVLVLHIQKPGVVPGASWD
jgi:hypothetical protein